MVLLLATVFVRCCRCLGRGMRRLAAGRIGLHLIPVTHRTVHAGRARNRVIGQYNLPDSLVLGPPREHNGHKAKSSITSRWTTTAPRTRAEFEYARFSTLRHNLTSFVAQNCPGKTDAEARLTQS